MRPRLRFFRAANSLAAGRVAFDRTRIHVQALGAWWKELSPMARFGITILARAKHKALYAAAKRFKSIKQFSEHINVHYTTVYKWLSLQAAPPIVANVNWPQEKLDALESKLMELTGESLEQLFPDEIRDRNFRSLNKTREFDREIDLKRLADVSPDVLCLPSPDEVLCQEDLSDKVHESLKILSYREREIVALRYGLKDGHAYTLSEVADVFKVGKERVRQIEMKAVRKLRSSPFGKLFEQMAPDEWTEPERDFRKFDNRPDRSLREVVKAGEARATA